MRKHATSWFQAWASLLLFFAAGIATANETIQIKKETTTLHGSTLPVSVLRDSSGKITSQEAYDRFRAGDFVANQVNPNYGYTGDTVWLAFIIERDIEAPNEWMLTIEPSTLDFLQLFQFSEFGDPLGRKKITGDAIPVKHRDNKSNIPAFGLDLPSHKSIFLVRTQTTSQMTLMPTLTEAKTYRSNMSSYMLLMGLYYGFVIASLIISYFGWRIIRNKEYLFFIFYLFITACFWFTFDGFAGIYVLPDHPILANKLLGVLLCASYITSNILIAAILKIKKSRRIPNAILMAINLLAGFSAASIFTGHFSIFFPILLFSMFVVYAVLGSHAARQLISGEIDLKIFSAAYLIYGAGTMLTIAMNHGFIPANDITLHGSQVSYLAFVLVLHFSLHWKFKDYRLSIAKSSYELELLNKKMEVEKKSSEEQTQLLHMIDHEIRTPVSIINSSVQSLHMLDHIESSKTEREKRYKKIQRAINRLEMLMHVARNAPSKNQKSIGSQPIDPALIIGDVLNYFSPIRQRINFEQKETNIGRVAFDKNHLDFVISNLIDNANKYSPEGSVIEIRTERATHNGKKAISIVICNETRHPTESYCGKVFDKYARFDEQSGEPGLGMGLYLSREIIQSAGGSIEANCPADQTFCIRLMIPIAIESTSSIDNLVTDHTSSNLK
jgi:signal transduction histidine kinase